MVREKPVVTGKKTIPLQTIFPVIPSPSHDSDQGVRDVPPLEGIADAARLCLCEGAASEMADEIDPLLSGNTQPGRAASRDNRPPGLTGDQLS